MSEDVKGAVRFTVGTPVRIDFERPWWLRLWRRLFARDEPHNKSVITSVDTERGEFTIGSCDE